jgi:GTPase SAR1 family protein
MVVIPVANTSQEASAKDRGRRNIIPPNQTQAQAQFQAHQQQGFVEMIRTHLTPIAQSWGYRDEPLEHSIKGPPMVLILGNYSSGKSTLINELIGQEVQKTGQAPTDDSFTILTYDDSPGDERSADDSPKVRDIEGHAIFQDEDYPFAPLKSHGQKFASHFRMKKLKSPFLKSLMLVDTPGMIDSIAERDRGYDYQKVISDLAQVADLVLVLFDPHKAGTLRESYQSLRDTLPQSTFDNRVVFVMNRIDECQTLPDLLRVYGVLCWNLSQMLGRKDIPPIRLSYSQQIKNPPAYLEALEEERTYLGQLMASAPELRVDHLKSFARIHGERLQFLAKSMIAYHELRRSLLLKSLGLWSIVAVAAGVGSFLWMLFQNPESMDLAGLAGGAVGLLVAVLWALFVRPMVRSGTAGQLLRTIDQWVHIKNQNDRDHWLKVKPMVQALIKTPTSKVSPRSFKRDLKTLNQLLSNGLKPAAPSPSPSVVNEMLAR